MEDNKYKKALEILELPIEFSLKELKKMYREKLKANHPDKTNTNTNKIQEIKESYELLHKYFENYKISFKDEDIKLAPDEFMKKKIMNNWKIY